MIGSTKDDFVVLSIEEYNHLKEIEQLYDDMEYLKGKVSDK